MNPLLKLAQPFFPKQLPKLPSVGANTPKSVGANTPKPGGGVASNTPNPAVGGVNEKKLQALEDQFKATYNRYYGDGPDNLKNTTPKPSDPASWTFGGKRDIDRFENVSMSDLQKKPAVGGASNTPKPDVNPAALDKLEKQFQDAYNRHYGHDPI